MFVIYIDSAFKVVGHWGKMAQVANALRLETYY